MGAGQVPDPVLFPGEEKFSMPVKERSMFQDHIARWIPANHHWDHFE
jgi:hypothetical protein